MANERQSSDLPSPAKLSMSSTRSHANDEETLPLYSSFQESSENNKTDSLPESKANPDEVRDYLTSLLIEKRNLHIDHVRRIVSRWTVGTGQELRSYPPQMYLDLFGREDGWMVYKEVKLVEMREKAEKTKPGERAHTQSKWTQCMAYFPSLQVQILTMHVSSVAIFVLISAIDVVFWCLFFKNSHGYVQIPAVIAALVFTFFAIVTLCVLCDGPKSEEKMVKEIEEELQGCLQGKGGE